MKKALLLPLLIFAAAAAHAQTTILSESFNTTTRTVAPPSGWTVTGTGTNDLTCSSSTASSIVWEQVPSGGFNCSGTPNPVAHSGSGMAGYNAWSIYSGGVSELVTPVLNFSGLGTTTLKVWIWDSVAYYAGSPNPQYDSMAIYVNTSPSSAGGTELYRGTPSYDFNGSGWTQFTFSIPTMYMGPTNYIIFRAASLWGNDLFFDDVEVIRDPPTPCAGTPGAATINNTAIPAVTPLCSGSSVTLTATDPNAPTVGGFNYLWQSSSSLSGPWTTVSTATAPTTGNTVTYNTGAIPASTYYRLRITCIATGNSSNSNVYYVPVGAPQPAAITGNSSFCPGDVTTYSVPATASTTYAWSLPTGWTGSSTTNSITVTPNNTPGNISVTATNSCGTSVPQTKAIVAGTAPLAPAAITGNSAPCGNTNQTYTTAGSASATGYTWTIPSGWSMSGTSNGGKTMTAVAGLTSGNITVTATNGCGSNTRTLAVSVISSLDSPGAIVGTTTPCAGGLYTYSVSNVTGASSYIWSLPPGWSGTNSGRSIQVYAGSSGTLSVTAYSPCATSPVSSELVTVQPSVTPTVSVTASAPVCQGAVTAITANATNGGTTPVFLWKKNGHTVIASGNTYLDNSLANGDLITATLISSAACRSADTVVSAAFSPSVTPRAVPGISINSTPVVTICQGDPLYFKTTITSPGTAPKYQWFINGIPVSGASSPTFSTSAAQNDDTVSVEMNSDAVCATDSIARSNKVGIIVRNLVVPSISINASSTAPSQGMPITFTAVQSGGGPTPDFQWIVNNVDVPGETGPSFTTATLRGGDHVAVRLQSYAECANPRVVTSEEVVMEGGGLSVGNPGNWQGALALYPNPSAGRFTLSVERTGLKAGERVRVEVLSLVGQRVYERELEPGAGQGGSCLMVLELGDEVSSGQYMIRLSTRSGMSAMLPLSLQR